MDVWRREHAAENASRRAADTGRGAPGPGADNRPRPTRPAARGASPAWALPACCVAHACAAPQAAPAHAWPREGDGRGTRAGACVKRASACAGTLPVRRPRAGRGRVLPRRRRRWDDGPRCRVLHDAAAGRSFLIVRNGPLRRTFRASAHVCRVRLRLHRRDWDGTAPPRVFPTSFRARVPAAGNALGPSLVRCSPRRRLPSVSLTFRPPRCSPAVSPLLALALPNVPRAGRPSSSSSSRR